MSSQKRGIDLTVQELTRASRAGVFAAVHPSIEGQDFWGIREWAPGDPMRSVDWAKSAASCKRQVRLREDERTIRVAFLVDCSHSILLSGRGRSKKNVVSYLLEALSEAATHKRALVRFVLFSNRVELDTRDISGRDRVQVVLSRVKALEAHPHRRTDFSVALKYAWRQFARPSLVIIISDFIGLEETADWQRTLESLASVHSVVLLMVVDSRDQHGPSGLVRCVGIESGVKRLAFFRPSGHLERVESAFADLGKRGVLFGDTFLTTDSDKACFLKLVRLFEQRKRLSRSYRLRRRVS